MSNKSKLALTKMNRNHFSYAIRKFSIGAASVLLGIGLAGALTSNVHAASTTMTGIVHVNPVANHPTWKILLWDGEGHNTGVFIKPNTDWKVFEKKDINGIEYYRLGTDKQWVQAQYVDAAKASATTPAAKHAIYTTNSETALVDGNGNATGATLPANTDWKAFASKTINGKTYYRLGTDKQWAPAENGSLNGSVPSEGSYDSSSSYVPSDDDTTTTTTPSDQKAQLVQELRTKLAKKVDVPYVGENQIVKISDVLSAHGVTLPEGYNAMFSKAADGTPTTEAPFGPTDKELTYSIEIDDNHGNKVGNFETHFTLNSTKVGDTQVVYLAKSDNQNEQDIVNNSSQEYFNLEYVKNDGIWYKKVDTGNYLGTIGAQTSISQDDINSLKGDGYKLHNADEKVTIKAGTTENPNLQNVFVDPIHDTSAKAALSTDQISGLNTTGDTSKPDITEDSVLDSADISPDQYLQKRLGITSYKDFAKLGITNASFDRAISYSWANPSVMPQDLTKVEGSTNLYYCSRTLTYTDAQGTHHIPVKVTIKTN